MSAPQDYRAFLESKIVVAAPAGFDISDDELHPSLKPVQRAAIRWAVRGGRRALFKKFGLGKTRDQIEIERLILHRIGGRGLIVAPLGVRQEFIREGAALGVEVRFIRRIEEAGPTGIYLTNYETVRDGKLNPRLFDVVSLDEASCLRGFGGSKTFREFMRLFEGVRFKFVATATPSPNEYIELLAYSAFLEIMDVSQAKTRFFKRNSEKADSLTIHPHKAEEFWLWVATWALFISKPSDLGFSDEGYDLPPLDVRWHEVAADYGNAGSEVDGQGRLLPRDVIGVQDAARVKRDSLDARVALAMEILSDAANPGREESLRQGVLCQEQGTPAAKAEGAKSRKLPATQRGIRGTRQGRASQKVRSDEGRLSRHLGRAVRGLCDLHEELSSDATGSGSRSSDGSGSGHSVRSVQHGAGAAGRRPGEDQGGRGLSDQFLVWCDLNSEQRSMERALAGGGISCSSLDGSQDIDLREQLLEEWRRGETDVFLTKPSMYGAGINLQQACRAIFVGVGFKFQDIIQAIHRLYRFGQGRRVRIDIIHSEAERDVVRRLQRRWKQHDEQVAKMGEIIRAFGLSEIALGQAMKRAMGVERVEVSGETWRLVNNDTVEETRAMAPDSVDLIVTSIPFSTQYEYSPNYADFGHTDDNAHFWRQMDYLIPELLRVLRPGRNACIHVKDRIQPGGLTGLGFQTVEPFSDECVTRFRAHGFAFLARKTIVTDVVRENNQTYRLGWTEQCKDGSRMGAGMPEYLLVFRKPPTDRSDGYADRPVVKSKPQTIGADGSAEPWRDKGLCIPGTGYSRGRWQFDAHGFERSSGDRLLRPEDLDGLDHKGMYRAFRRFSLAEVYDFEHHVRIAEHVEEKGRLPVTFMLFPPQSWHEDVWTDVARMRTLNMLQAQAGREGHLCCLQFDIVDRAITQMSMPGETVFDPFAGLGTVPYCAVKLGRRGLGTELSPGYFVDSIRYLEAAAREKAIPSLFDLIGIAPAVENEEDPLPIELQGAA